MIRVSTKVMGIIKGRVVRHDGSPAAAEVMLRTEGDDRAAFVKTDPKTGGFSSPWLVPGRWRVTVEKDRVGDVEGGEHDLDPGETLDLGDIKLPEPGTLVIDLEAPEAIADQVVYSILPKSSATPGGFRRGFATRSRSRTKTSRSRSRFRRALTPSMSRGRAWRDSSLAFTIEPGKETRVAVAARAGIACEVRVAFPEGEPRSGVGYHFIPVSGGKAVSGSAHWNGKDETASGTSVVQPGTYKLQAGTRGLRKEQEVVVPAGETKVVFDNHARVSLAGGRGSRDVPIHPPRGQERYSYRVLRPGRGRAERSTSQTAARPSRTAGAIEAKVRLKPGKLRPHPDPASPAAPPAVRREAGGSAQVFEFTVDPP